jgi:hypothetical protein
MQSTKPHLVVAILLALLLLSEISFSSESLSFEDFRNFALQLPNGAYVVDGDLLIKNEAELLEYFNDHIRNSQDPTVVRSVVLNVDGKDSVWPQDEKHNLTYCIGRNDFHVHDSSLSPFTTDYYFKVVNALRSASAAWENVADVNFKHLQNNDEECNKSNHNVVFRVKSGNALSGVEAAAFWPHWGSEDRELKIDPYVVKNGPSGPVSLTGLLTHELGHILGLAHEQVRAESGCGVNDGTWRELTEYDNASVMHYRNTCGGINADYYITSLDQAGIQTLYGAPEDSDPEEIVEPQPNPDPQPKNIAPVAHPGGPYDVSVGDPLTLYGSLSSDKDGGIVSWRWDFGDGTTAGPTRYSTGEIVRHVYKKPGLYTIALVVNDGELDSSQAETTAVVRAKGYSLRWLLPTIIGAVLF